MLRAIILVGLGGAAGSILRYLTSVFVTKYIPATFPWGTFTVNILGCLLAGVVLGLFEKQLWTNPELKLLLMTGFCGGYTTFSAFTAENLNLIQSGNSLTGLIYILSSVLVSLVAIWVGFAVTR